MVKTKKRPRKEAEKKDRSGKGKGGGRGPGKGPGKGKKKKPQPRFTAKTADKHELYQLAVQSPEEDVKFLAKVYHKVRGKHALHLREDFCGTGLLAATWVDRGDKYSAEGFDIDTDVLAWGRERNVKPLGDAASRLTLHEADVREKGDRPADVRCAHNFSYSLFKTRSELLEYLRAAHADLAEDGIFSIDIHGGPESMEEMEEEREIDEGFDYIWQQKRYWPATGEYLCHIHFRFPDGTEMKKAFTYDWRLWTLPELVDVLYDAGFSQVDSYWEGTDSDGETGDGNFKRHAKGENCLSWITYVIAQK